MSGGNFESVSSRNVEFSLSTVTMENIEGKVEAALKSKLAEALGVNEGDLSVL